MGLKLRTRAMTSTCRLRALAVPADHLASQEFSFPHDSLGLVLSFAYNDGYWPDRVVTCAELEDVGKNG